MMNEEIKMLPEELMHAICRVKEQYPSAWVKALDDRLEFHMCGGSVSIPCAVIFLRTGIVTLAEPDNVYVSTYHIDHTLRDPSGIPLVKPQKIEKGP